MPGGDRTGPAGAGAMTGRRAGFCTGNSIPGYAVNNRGRGMGICRGIGGGFGRGRGWGFSPAANYASGLQQTTAAAETAQQLSALKLQAENLENSLINIRKQIDTLENTSE